MKVEGTHFQLKAARLLRGNWARYARFTALSAVRLYRDASRDNSERLRRKEHEEGGKALIAKEDALLKLP